MIVFKAIKPSRLNDKNIADELNKEMTAVKDDILKDFNKTVRYWKHKPKFENVREIKPNGPTIMVGTDDEIYRYVNEGTRWHIIRAGVLSGRSNKKYLSWRSPFTPKTTVGVLESGKGSIGKVRHYAQVVFHPGTEARDFDSMIEKKWIKPFKRRMQEAMKRGAARSGNGVS